MDDSANVLLVEDEKNSRTTLTVLLEDNGHRVVACSTAEEAINYLTSGDTTEVVVSGLKLPDGSGLQILWALKRLDPTAAFILITGHASLETAIEAVNEGAFAYHVKPLDLDALSRSVSNARRQQKLVLENRRLLSKRSRSPTQT